MPDALTPDPAGRRASLTVQTLPLAVLKPHPANPRRHPTPGSPEWNTLKASLESEYFDPIVWNRRNGMLVSGHLRTKVLREAGFTEADCVVVDMDEPTHKARMLAANRLTGEDDMQAVKDLLESLDTGEISTDLTGYSEAAIEQLMNQVHQDDPAPDAEQAEEESDGQGYNMTSRVRTEKECSVVAALKSKPAGKALVCRLKDAEGSLPGEVEFWAGVLADMIPQEFAACLVTCPAPSGKRTYSLAAHLAQEVAKKRGQRFAAAFTCDKERGHRASMQEKLREKERPTTAAGLEQETGVVIVDDMLCTGYTLTACVNAANCKAFCVVLAAS